MGAKRDPLVAKIHDGEAVAAGGTDTSDLVSIRASRATVGVKIVNGGAAPTSDPSYEIHATTEYPDEVSSPEWFLWKTVTGDQVINSETSEFHEVPIVVQGIRVKATAGATNGSTFTGHVAQCDEQR